MQQPPSVNTACLICSAPINPFHSFGLTPIANGFLTKDQFGDEYKFELNVGFCTSCAMVQLINRVDPEKLFHDNYAYFSSISVRMAEHFKEFAGMVRASYLSEDKPFVVEIGSNDGILLQNFAQAKIKHLGVEPSENVAKEAISKGINTFGGFFNEETAAQIKSKHGLADAVLGANVICHIPDLHGLIKGVNVLLKDNGVFIFEEPYLADIIEKTSYDQIYDEHIFYFSVHSLSNIFARHGLEIIDLQHQDTHGGSMRYVVARKGKHPVKPVVAEFLRKENALGLGSLETYKKFSARVFDSKTALKKILGDIRGQGKRIAGYGATSKSTTVMNFCGIGPELIEFVSDTTPGKQGKYTPGVHVPVVPYDVFKNSPPDYALLFAWNHANEILSKEKEFLGRGGKFIVYVPTVKIIG